MPRLSGPGHPSFRQIVRLKPVLALLQGQVLEAYLSLGRDVRKEISDKLIRKVQDFKYN